MTPEQTAEKARSIVDKWYPIDSGSQFETLHFMIRTQIADKIAKEIATALLEADKTARDEQMEIDAKIAESLSILADHEKECCGDIPEMMLRTEIAEAIRSQEKP